MLDDILEIENIIPVDHQKYICDTMTGFNFPWVLNKNIVSGDDCFINQKNNPPGFNHFFYEHNKATSSFFEMVYPIVLSLTSRYPTLPFNRLLRMRGNLTLANQSTDLDKFMPHIDSFFPHVVAIYYVNDSDGDTIIFDQSNDNYDSGEKDIDTIKNGTFTVKRRITPKQGKLLVFSGNRYHTASFCKNTDYRCLINMNLGKILL
jgi:hypothetical protein